MHAKQVNVNCIVLSQAFNEMILSRVSTFGDKHAESHTMYVSGLAGAVVFADLLLGFDTWC